MHERITGDPSSARPAGSEDAANDLRDRLERLLDGPGPELPEDWDLLAAIRALKQLGAPRYRGEIDPAQLEEALDGLGFAFGGLPWLASLGQTSAGPAHPPRALRVVQAAP